MAKRAKVPRFRRPQAGAPAPAGLTLPAPRPGWRVYYQWASAGDVIRDVFHVAGGPRESALAAARRAEGRRPGFRVIDAEEVTIRYCFIITVAEPDVRAGWVGVFPAGADATAFA
jgi:hypothetical protein